MCYYKTILTSKVSNFVLFKHGNKIVLYQLYNIKITLNYSISLWYYLYKACPSESGTEVGAPLFPAVELCDFSGRWQCMSGEIWYTLDSGSVLLTETEAR